MRSFSVATESTVTDQLIADWVITAIECGISYWCDTAMAVERDEQGQWQEMSTERYKSFMTKDGCGPYANPEFWENDCRGYRLFADNEEECAPKVLTLAALLKALKHQPKQQRGISDNWFRKVVARLISEDYDSADADCIVQIAVFNEVVYG